ncbi:sigma-70 family RNA polymerase sigma factor [Bradyrhizobium sp. BRP22]|uniref:RNA polymerase sigma factor n=1 Tax=Bradyrhizobium sp. BRP22 TaxID=2793821 RepID=UPI001CD1A97C|nr:sigma-70 family RNA polymerase sigma factor [Bradyrhizobium sp. BRP22]MCA1454172.1 sigma-70 family RNA polymerase sigma factor [Bradyrhizobium sp. BRP22]
MRRAFLLGYDDLKLRLTKRLGSIELAGDSLQEAWISLERAAPIGPVLRPQSYIFRIAYNIALKRLRRERDVVTLDQAIEELDLVDEAPGPAEVTEGRAEWALLAQAAKELTPRRLDILFAVRLEGLSIRDVATKHDISERLVALELKQAVLHCAERLKRNVVSRFSSGPSEGSHREGAQRTDEPADGHG